MILIYDYGIGNTGSIKNMIRRMGLNSEISSELELVRDASVCIIPGVGSFDTCVSEFMKQDSSQVLLERIASGLKTLGICVGMQMLFEQSEEGELKGLGLIPGEVKKFNHLDLFCVLEFLNWADDLIFSFDFIFCKYETWKN